MLTGYARISQDSQSIDLQIDALRAAGCEKIFSDTMSGSRNNRPGLLQALEFVRSADVICVWRLDRLGRSLSHLIGLMQDLERRGIGFRSLTEAIDTTTIGGRLTFNLFARWQNSSDRCSGSGHEPDYRLQGNVVASVADRDH
jgi:DNA invertase Pin-like site-specific DNA recombinase